MTSRIFSINLDDVTFAKLGELQKKYPDKSRNGMIRHIIHVVHSGEVEDLSSTIEHLEKELKFFMGLKEWKVLVAVKLVIFVIVKHGWETEKH